MKNFITKFAAYIIIAVTLVMLVPGLSNRISNEQQNGNVTISVLYNGFRNNLSKPEIGKLMNEFKSIGVNRISILEDDLNALVSRGDITSIKYNVLRHKYDDESMEMADFIAEKCPEISYNSHIVIASREEAREKLAYVLPLKYSAAEYADLGLFEDMHIYVFYDGRKELYEYTLGYDEKVLDELSEKGFEIALVYQVKNYSVTDYCAEIDRIVKKYGVEYINLKANAREYTGIEINKDNYKKFIDIINGNDMTLVVTENTDQLSNQQFLGYVDVFNAVVGEGGSRKVVRSYETYDDSQQDESKYKYRAEQFLNSTIDRNIRFVTVTPMTLDFTSHEDSAGFTVKAVSEYKTKIEGLGYTVNGAQNPMDYRARHTLNAALCAVLMVMCLLLMYQMVWGKKNFGLTMAAIVIAVLAFGGTCVIPASLRMLYPTVFCVVQSCMAITAVLYFIKFAKDKLPALVLAPASIFIVLAVLLLGAVGMGAMLSGMEYYVNNVIFRGIKISLIVPVVYTVAAYYLMFMRDRKSSVTNDIKNVLNAEVKMYWLLIAAVVAAVGMYYLIRSGNVSSISSLEKNLRSTVTELFPARPRTKEFLIGYPALVLFAYYVKNSDIQLVKWLLAIATSILAASITNSFCHIFTDFTVIVTRTFNGLILGIAVAIAAYIANIVLLKVLKYAKKRLGF